MSGSDEVLAITTNEKDNANQLNENNTFNTGESLLKYRRCLNSFSLNFSFDSKS